MTAIYSLFSGLAPAGWLQHGGCVYHKEGELAGLSSKWLLRFELKQA